jgi:hypothetical protein
MAQTLALWFRRRYQLSPRDPRFLELTPEDVAAEFWAHHYADAPPGEEAEDDNFEAAAAAMAAGEEWEDM